MTAGQRSPRSDRISSAGKTLPRVRVGGGRMKKIPRKKTGVRRA